MVGRTSVNMCRVEGAKVSKLRPKVNLCTGAARGVLAVGWRDCVQSQPPPTTQSRSNRTIQPELVCKNSQRTSHRLPAHHLPYWHFVQPPRKQSSKVERWAYWLRYRESNNSLGSMDSLGKRRSAGMSSVEAGTVERGGCAAVLERLFVVGKKKRNGWLDLNSCSVRAC